jgi:RNA polymerase sigma-70 factor (ECF subfamily)
LLENEGLGEDHSYEESDHLVTEELRERIDEAVNSLPDKCREIFIRNRMENKKYQEIADELNLSVKTVEAQMSKALKILREKLSDYMGILIIIIEIF